MGYRKDDGSWHDTCLDKLKHGEPFFVLRAQDIFAAEAVEAYADALRRSGLNAWPAYGHAREFRAHQPKKIPD